MLKNLSICQTRQFYGYENNLTCLNSQIISHYRCYYSCFKFICSSVCPSVRLSVYLSVCLFVRLSICPSVCLSAWLFVCLDVCPSVRLSVRLSVYLHVCLSICPSVCLSVHLSICPSVYLFDVSLSVFYYFKSRSNQPIFVTLLASKWTRVRPSEPSNKDSYRYWGTYRGTLGADSTHVS